MPVCKDFKSPGKRRDSSLTTSTCDRTSWRMRADSSSARARRTPGLDARLARTSSISSKLENIANTTACGVCGATIAFRHSRGPWWSSCIRGSRAPVRYASRRDSWFPCAIQKLSRLTTQVPCADGAPAAAERGRPAVTAQAPADAPSQDNRVRREIMEQSPLPERFTLRDVSANVNWKCITAQLVVNAKQGENVALVNTKHDNHSERKYKCCTWPVQPICRGMIEKRLVERRAGTDGKRRRLVRSRDDRFCRPRQE